MTTALDLYDSHLKLLSVKHPQDEPAMRAAMQAFDAIKAGQNLTPSLLEPIVKLASDSRKRLFEIPVDFLDQLTAEHDMVRQAVIRMASDKASHTRYNAIMCIGKAAPISFQLQLLRQGLRDKSSQVRSKAADWATRLRLAELVPDLEQALATEQHDKARASIEFGLQLLCNRHIVATEPDGTIRITAYTPHGISTRWFEQSEFESRGMETIIAEIYNDKRGS